MKYQCHFKKPVVHVLTSSNVIFDILSVYEFSKYEFSEFCDTYKSHGIQSRVDQVKFVEDSL